MILFSGCEWLNIGIRQYYGWLCIGPYNFTWWFRDGAHCQLIDKRKVV